MNPDDQIGGAGWYHPDDRDGLCLVRLFGVGFSVGFYYEGIPKPRVTFNFANEHLANVAETGQFVDCPPPLSGGGTPAAGQFLGTSEFNVYAGPQVSQSTLLCLKTFSLCAPDPDTARWLLYDCNGYDGAGSGKNNANQVVFGAGDLVELNLGVGIGASRVTDGCSREDNPLTPDVVDPDSDVKAYDATPYLSDQLQRLGSLPDVHLDQLCLNDDPTQPCPYNTTYVVSCYTIDVALFPEGVIDTATTHDWFLVLGENVNDWGPALLYHEEAPQGDANPKKFAPGHVSLAEQGLYDLSGDNGCPSTMVVVDKELCPHLSYRPGTSSTCTTGDPDKKSKDNPLVTV